MFFYDSFLQTSLNDDVINQMINDEELEKRSDISVNESAHDTSSECDCDRFIMKNQVKELTDRVIKLESDLKQSNEKSEETTALEQRVTKLEESTKQQFARMRMQIFDFEQRIEVIERTEHHLLQYVKDCDC